MCSDELATVPFRGDDAQYGAIDSHNTRQSTSDFKLDRRSPANDEIPSLLSVLTKDVVDLCISNFAMCLSSEVLFSLYPLFAFTPIQSGWSIFHLIANLS